MGEGHRLRIGRSSASGQIYLITICCHERRSVFDSIPNWICLTRSLGALSTDTYTWCYVAMPDHVHWLMQLDGALDLSRCVQKLKSLTVKELRRCGFSNSAIWQRGFHDRALRDEEDLKTVARYVIANPVRAGLVDSIRDYPFWDAAWI